MIKVVVKEPGKFAEVREIERGLNTFQKIVMGRIEGTALPGIEDVYGYCNEDGLYLENCLPNYYRPEYCDAVMGPAVFLGDDGEGGDISLTDSQIEQVKKYLDKNTVKSMEEFRFHVITKFKFCKK